MEKHIRTELKTLYRDIIIQKCLLEQQILNNALIIATLKPDEFANIVMKSPGHMALVAGEVIHIVKCIPVQVKIRKTDECYIRVTCMVEKQFYVLNTSGQQKTTDIAECRSTSNN